MLKDLKTLRNLNIAVVVLSAIGIGAAVFALIMCAVANAAVSAEMSGSFTVDSLDIDGAMAYPDDTVSDIQALHSTIIIGAVLFVLSLIVSALNLVVGIQGMNVLKNEKRLNRMFVLFIVFAAINVVDGNLITGVLFIISAVFMHRLRKVPFSVLCEQQAHPELMFVGPGYPAPAYPYAQPAQPYAQPGYAQAPYGQPVGAPYGQAGQAQPFGQAPWGQPVQPAQPYGQPVAPAQPYADPAQAAAPVAPAADSVSSVQAEQPAAASEPASAEQPVAEPTQYAQAEAPVEAASAEAADFEAAQPVVSTDEGTAAEDDGKKGE
ncbi:MAG: hypothetical protein Q4A43_01970 [Coriobacteriia bacterium]|nr:hypothetical protein [Coriobacteriia bacterium]